ncbi:hypothetical protein [Natrinema sp. 1APR25-10V2]|uniref:hypothetical protein n=1 Tax=Natrinema sp. 1APR25-10V2 TaxID=2951081 RepID=UPI0028740CC0|nr:hypothetical protein [Natrinema sp. 1APR25-10V2]MDS0474658.1 hypothetical protein [Natrinema sp. 1APR25-10V2]
MTAVLAEEAAPGGMGGGGRRDDGGGGMGGGDGGPGGGMGGQMGDRRPPYAGLLVNGRLPESAPTFDVRHGERVRFRFVNAGSATAFRVRLAGHELTVTHADGRPVEPVAADSFVFGSGERYDVVVEADTPGAWELRADALDGDELPARAVVRYEGSGESGSPTAPSAEGRRLQYGDLQDISPLEGIDGQPDRQFDLDAVARPRVGRVARRTAPQRTLAVRRVRGW